MCLFGTAFFFGTGRLEAQAQAGSAEQALEQLESKATGKKLADRQLQKAREALRRAKAARSKGALERALLLEALARQWAVSGLDLVRTAELEDQALAVERRLLERSAALKRARTLLEATVVRIGLAKEKLKRVESQGSNTPEANP